MGDNMASFGSGSLLWVLITLILNFFAGMFGSYNESGASETQESIKEIVVEVNESDKPAMVEARLKGRIENYYIENTYDLDYLSRDVVGMVGVPIYVGSYYEDIIEGKLMLTFVYDEDKLTCDEEDLGILYYNEEDYWYDTVLEIQVDYENNEISVPVESLGTYILEDMETWVAVWDGSYDYIDEMEEPECHWHNEFNYEDIEALADVSLYDESGEYHITTVEQLAGLVKLVNEGESFYGCNFYLDSDLDLAGYDWVPIGWYFPADNGNLWQDFPFEGRFYGNGHAIYNMYICQPEQSDLGMFGRTLQGFQVHDLALIDCYIEGKFYVGGILGDNINSGESFDVTNCIVTGTVKGELNVGAIVGSSAYLQIKDCYAVMEEGSTIELTGDLRGGYTENCHINDEVAQEKLEDFWNSK